MCTMTFTIACDEALDMSKHTQLIQLKFLIIYHGISINKNNNKNT